jgi:RNA polymerase sigma-70 factor (ECF subfamily)
MIYPLTSRQKRFEKLVSPFVGPLFKLAYFRMGNTQDAEDAVQDTLLKAYRSFGTFETGTNARAWLTKILLNASNDLFSKRTRQLDTISLDEGLEEIQMQQSASASLQNPELIAQQNEIDPALLAALRSLPSTLLFPLLLREIEELSYQEISTLISVPIGTVMSRLYRARQLVRARLEGTTENKMHTKNKDKSDLREDAGS